MFALHALQALPWPEADSKCLHPCLQTVPMLEAALTSRTLQLRRALRPRCLAAAGDVRSMLCIGCQQPMQHGHGRWRAGVNSMAFGMLRLQMHTITKVLCNVICRWHVQPEHDACHWDRTLP